MNLCQTPSCALKHVSHGKKDMDFALYRNELEPQYCAHFVLAIISCNNTVGHNLVIAACSFLKCNKPFDFVHWFFLQNSGIAISFTNLTAQTSSLLPIGRFDMWPLACTQRLLKRCSLTTQSGEQQKSGWETRGGTEVKLNVDSTHMWQDRTVLLMREKYSLKNKTLVWFSAGQSTTQRPDQTSAAFPKSVSFTSKCKCTKRWAK